MTAQIPEAEESAFGRPDASPFAVPAASAFTPPLGVFSPASASLPDKLDSTALQAVEAAGGSRQTPPAMAVEPSDGGSGANRLGRAGVLAASLAFSALVVWILFFSDMLAPMRSALFGSWRTTGAFKVSCALIAFFGLTNMLLRQGFKRILGIERRLPSPEEIERAMREGMEKAAAHGDAIMEEGIAKMRAEGCADGEIETFRNAMLASFEKANREAQIRMREMMAHPERAGVTIAKARQPVAAQATRRR
jgi:hypothetical protein